MCRAISGKQPGHHDINGGSITTSWARLHRSDLSARPLQRSNPYTASTVLADNSAHNVIFTSTVDSKSLQAWALTVNTAGYEVFNGGLAVPRPRHMTTDASGTIGGQVAFDAGGTTRADRHNDRQPDASEGGVVAVGHGAAAGGNITAYGTVDPTDAQQPYLGGSGKHPYSTAISGPQRPAPENWS